MGAGGVEEAGSTFLKNLGHRRMRLGSYGQRLGKFLVLLGKLLGEEFTRDARVFASGWTGRWSDRAIHLSRNFCRKEGLWKRF